MNGSKTIRFPRRRLSRIEALLILYAQEMAEINLKVAKKNYLRLPGTISKEELETNMEDESLFRLFLKRSQLDKFTTKLLNTITDNLTEIDSILRKVIRHWQLERLSVIDRNILRLGTAELLYFLDIPPKVSINEYIEITKIFGDSESSAFVNGVLDRIAKDFPAKISAPADEKKQVISESGNGQEASFA